MQKLGESTGLWSNDFVPNPSAMIGPLTDGLSYAGNGVYVGNSNISGSTSDENSYKDIGQGSYKQGNNGMGGSESGSYGTSGNYAPSLDPWGGVGKEYPFQDPDPIFAPLISGALGDNYIAVPFGSGSN